MEKLTPTQDSAKKSKTKTRRRNYWYAVGRRKSATARIRIWKKEEGEMEINEQPMKKYFPTADLQRIVLSPFKTVGDVKNKVTIRILGGGKHGQAQGIRHGIARALIEMNPDFREALKREGMLTRDPRVKERKKFGLKRARRAPQWSKR